MNVGCRNSLSIRPSGDCRSDSSIPLFLASKREKGPSLTSGNDADVVERDHNAPTSEHRHPLGDKHWKEQCRHTAWTLPKVLYKIDGHSKDSLLPDMPLEEAHPSATRPVTQLEDRRYIVDGGASLRLMGHTSLAPQEKKTIRKTSNVLEITVTAASSLARQEGRSLWKPMLPAQPLLK